MFHKIVLHIKVDNNDNDLPYGVPVIEMAKLATDKLLPMKSKEQYCKEHDLFVHWMEEKHVKSINECVLLAYFEDLAKTYSSINHSSNKVGHGKHKKIPTVYCCKHCKSRLFSITAIKLAGIMPLCSTFRV